MLSKKQQKGGLYFSFLFWCAESYIVQYFRVITKLSVTIAYFALYKKNNFYSIKLLSLSYNGVLILCRTFCVQIFTVLPKATIIQPAQYIIYLPASFLGEISYFRPGGGTQTWNVHRSWPLVQRKPIFCFLNAYVFYSLTAKMVINCFLRHGKT